MHSHPTHLISALVPSCNPHVYSNVQRAPIHSQDQESERGRGSVLAEQLGVP